MKSNEPHNGQENINIQQSLFEPMTTTAQSKQSTFVTNNHRVLQKTVLAACLFFSLGMVWLYNEFGLPQRFNTIYEIVNIAHANTTVAGVQPVENAYRVVDHVIKKNEVISTIAEQHDALIAHLYPVLQRSPALAYLTNNLRAGLSIHLHIDSENKLQKIIYPFSPAETFRLELNAGEYIATVDTVQYDKTLAYYEGTLATVLYLDAKKNGMSDDLIMRFANIFAWDIDLNSELRTGARFSLMYEKLSLNGEYIRDGIIRMARLVNAGEVYEAVYFATERDTNGRAIQEGFYSKTGQSMRKRFLRMPVKFGYISSSFNLVRVHPIFKTIRPHLGTDYAAKRGTPIHSVGKGVITTYGWMKGYGRVAIIDHGNGYTTLYAHMNSFRKGFKRGKRVRQGQIIGYVGTSGYSTGPHVHYEFRINGVAKNSVRVRLPGAPPIGKEQIKEFTVVHEQTAKVFNVFERQHG